MLKRKSKGFTLIELLIVIAIILILIAIALPNFLEAQIRAKVTRAEADLRNLQTAMESYRIDYPHYPRSFVWLYNDTSPMGWVDGWLKRLIPLTTPVQYVTEVPLDPFSISQVGVFAEEDRKHWEVYSYAEDYYGYYAPDLFPKGLVNVWGNSVTYHLTSPGPDGKYNYQQDSVDIPSGYWDDLPWLLKLYAPTNGTKSEGDILKWGGGSTGGCSDPSLHKSNGYYDSFCQ